MKILKVFIIFFLLLTFTPSEGKEYEDYLKKWLLKDIKDGVEVTLIFDTVELLKSYIEREVERNILIQEEKNQLKEKIIKDYSLEDSLCFHLEIKNKNRKKYAYLQMNPIEDSIILVDSSFKEYKMKKYDPCFKERIYDTASGKIHFPKIITEKTKWIKIKIYNLFPVVGLRVSLEPDFYFNYYLKGEKITSLTEWEEEKIVEEKININKETKIEEGMRLYKENKMDEAIVAFTEAIEQEPDSIVAYNLLGCIYIKKNLFDAAISILKKAIEIDPLSSLSHYNLGRAYREKQDWDKAIIEFKQAIGIDDEYLDAHYYLGLTYEDKGEKDLAKKEYEKVLNLNPNHNNAKERLEKLERQNVS